MLTTLWYMYWLCRWHSGTCTDYVDDTVGYIHSVVFFNYLQSGWSVWVSDLEVTSRHLDCITADRISKTMSTCMQPIPKNRLLQNVSHVRNIIICWEMRISYLYKYIMCFSAGFSVRQSKENLSLQPLFQTEYFNWIIFEIFVFTLGEIGN